MLVLAIRKSDDEVMDIRHDAPNHRPGNAIKAAVATFGGVEDDYYEYPVPDKDKLSVMTAKKLKWDKHDKRVKATPFSGNEKKLRELSDLLVAVENEMIQAQLVLDASEKLGLDTIGRKANRDRLKAQHEEVKEKKKQYE